MSTEHPSSVPQTEVQMTASASSISAPVVTTSLSSSSNAQVADAQLASLMRETTAVERKNAISSILRAIHPNPLAILQLPLDFTDSDIKQQYKWLSRRVHPDKCPALLKADAQTAFAKLTEAKNKILDPIFQKQLRVKIIKARNRVQSKLGLNHSATDDDSMVATATNSSIHTCVKPETASLSTSAIVKTEEDSSAVPSMSAPLPYASDSRKRKFSEMADGSGVVVDESGSQPDLKKARTAAVERSSELGTSSASSSMSSVPSVSVKLAADASVKAELNELLIDEAWETCIESKAADRLQKQHVEAREAMKSELEYRKERQKKRIETRDSRVANWRKFQDKKKRKKKKKKGL